MICIPISDPVNKYELAGIAMEKLIEMPEKNLDVIVFDEVMHICHLPTKITEIARMSHLELIEVLRYCPYSPNFAQTDE